MFTEYQGKQFFAILQLPQNIFFLAAINAGEEKKEKEKENEKKKEKNL